MHDTNSPTTVTSVRDGQVRYYEHLLAYSRSYFVPDSSEDIYPHINEDYRLIGHMVINVGEYGVLVLWSESELGAGTQSLLDHELEPDQSIYNIGQKQLLTEFRAWYNTQDAQTQQDYWHGKLAD